VPFIFLTAKGERPDVRAGMNLGADDYLTKPASAEEVVAAVESRLIRHRTLQMPGGAPDFSSATPLETLGLTQREAEVLLWVAQGKSNDETGTILNMSGNTAKIHLTHIYRKLNVENPHRRRPRGDGGTRPPQCGQGVLTYGHEIESQTS